MQGSKTTLTLLKNKNNHAISRSEESLEGQCFFRQKLLSVAGATSPTQTFVTSGQRQSALCLRSEKQQAVKRAKAQQDGFRKSIKKQIALHSFSMRVFRPSFNPG